MTRQKQRESTKTAPLDAQADAKKLQKSQKLQPPRDIEFMVISPSVFRFSSSKCRGFRGCWVADINPVMHQDESKSDLCAECNSLLQRVGGVILYEAALAQPRVAWCNACIST